MILTRKIAAGVAGVVAAGVLGTAGVAAATSDNRSDAGTPATASATPAPSSPAAPKGHHRRAKRLLVRGMHGEWVVKGKDGKPVTLESIRGTVTAVSSTRLTVKAEDGFTETFAVSSDTKVRGGADSLAEVKTGARAAVVGVKSGNTTTARMVLVRK